MLSKRLHIRMMWLFMAGLTLALIAAACSSNEPAPAAAPALDTAALQAAVQSAVQQANAAQAPQVTSSEILKMVETAVMDSLPTSSPAVAPADLQKMIEQAISTSAPAGASAEAISAMVEAAVMAASADAVTAAEIQDVVAMAVADSAASVLTAEEIQSIVAMELEAQAAAGPKDTIIFADFNWSSAQLQNGIARYIIENGYGYPTDAIFGGTDPLWQGFNNGDIDVMMEVWLPNSQPLWDAALAGGTIIPVGKSLDDNWQSGFVVPTYVIEGDASRGIDPIAPNLKTVADLVMYQDVFATAESDGKARLVSCLAAWNCSKIIESQVEIYNLEDVISLQDPGSSAALFASLVGAYEKGEPWLGYLWGPTQPAADLDLTLLEEPSCAPGAGPDTGCAFPTALVRIAVQPSLVQRAPSVIEFLRLYNFSAATQLSAEGYMTDTDASFADTAIWYLQNQEDVWTQWVPREVALKVKAALASE